MKPSERERIEHVYARYDTESAGATRWSASNPGNAALLGERSARIGEALGDLGGTVLDLGCGAGGEAGLLLEHGAALAVGVDIQQALLARRRDLLPQSPSVLASGDSLPFPAEAFSTVTLATMLSSVLDTGLRTRIAAEVHRVLRPGGRVVVYDMRYPNPRNRDVTPIPARHLETLFPGYSSTSRSLTLVPQVARRLGRLASKLYGPLARLPMLRTHLLTVLVKPG
jgi:ubiquinone/menaquinone biosynthesis C-methylase UbiE